MYLVDETISIYGTLTPEDCESFTVVAQLRLDSWNTTELLLERVTAIPEFTASFLSSRFEYFTFSTVDSSTHIELDGEVVFDFRYEAKRVIQSPLRVNNVKRWRLYTGKPATKAVYSYYLTSSRLINRGHWVIQDSQRGFLYSWDRAKDKWIDDSIRVLHRGIEAKLQTSLLFGMRDGARIIREVPELHVVLTEPDSVETLEMLCAEITTVLSIIEARRIEWVYQSNEACSADGRPSEIWEEFKRVTRLEYDHDSYLESKEGYYIDILRAVLTSEALKAPQVLPVLVEIAEDMAIGNCVDSDWKWRMTRWGSAAERIAKLILGQEFKEAGANLSDRIREAGRRVGYTVQDEALDFITIRNDVIHGTVREHRPRYRRASRLARQLCRDLFVRAFLAKDE